ncbi:hypothetical protein CDL12_14816 [Handroanthus impetiginosus]|uniref:Uncharacterized protein n=1 Tax=Handroanthus impetiginosus TaxID=429701 RepID=A0A2G9H4W7_9LAMI|nr:hypothetical protein CDL12_14816 [Handroanthus impetiginosus]
MGSSHGPSVAKYVILISMLISLSFTQLSGLRIPSINTESGRFLAETDYGSESRHLDDTVRADPLDGLKKYRGGYDITNKHYWGSTVFTGIYGYVLAVVWVLCGVGYGGFLIIMNRINRRKLKKRLPCHKQCYLEPLILSVLLTVLAIIALGLVLGGNAKFHSRANKVIDIIIDTADEASDTIYNTTGAMKEMSSSLGGVNGSSQATSFLSSTSRRLDAQAADIARQASKNRRLIDRIFDIVYIVTTVTISLTLVTVVALLVFGVLKFQRTVQVLIILCWIFTALCWFYFGIYFFLQNFVGDTCTALESFQQDPYNNSLSSILPCDELLSAESVLDDVSEGVYNLVDEVNYNISTSYGNIVQICNPFSPPPLYEYHPSNCSQDSLRIGDIPRVLRQLVCPDSEGQTCNGGILISANDYNTIEAYSTSIQRLLDVYPGMESLVECQTVTDAFSEIIDKHCSPLKRHIRMVWVSLVILSVVMMALVLVWTARARHGKRHHALGGSVKPHSTSADVLESGKATQDSI